MYHTPNPPPPPSFDILALFLSITINVREFARKFCARISVFCREVVGKMEGKDFFLLFILSIRKIKFSPRKVFFFFFFG